MNSPQLRFQFIEIAASETDILLSKLVNLGFQAYPLADGKSLYRQHDIDLIINHHVNSDENALPYIRGIGFIIEDKLAYIDTLTKKQLTVISPLEYDLPFHAIPSPGSCWVYLLTQDEWCVFTRQPSRDNVLQLSTGLLEAIDHLAICCKEGHLPLWQTFFENLGLLLVDDLTIHVNDKTTHIQIFADAAMRVRIPVGEAIDKDSHVEAFVRDTGQDGIQHIAFHTSHILAAMHTIQAKHVGLHRMDDSYYESLEALPYIGEHLAEKLQRAGVLFDGIPDAYLMQVFTEALIGHSSIEIIQRHNHLGFGQQNITALFQAAEA